jgi:type II restriction enzyme
MKLGFSEPQRNYDSGSQSARHLTEAWVADQMYCPNCGNIRLNQFPANLPVADFYCANCNDQYELKSQRKNFGTKLANGAYATKLQRLSSNTSPNLILMSYDNAAASVTSIVLIPKRFFVPSIVEKRRPLAVTARRAGWVGSNILIGLVPASGRIHVVQDGVTRSKDAILAQWQKTAFLDEQTQATKGWLVDVMSCVDRLPASGFSLDDVYQFEAHLSRLHPDNNNVRPKIRQQLQVLRDNGYLEFLGNGHYRLAQ